MLGLQQFAHRTDRHDLAIRERGNAVAVMNGLNAIAARADACSAHSADEQAVSTLMHGPCMPSTNERRPHATDIVSPVTAYTDEGRSDESSAQSGRSMPTKTPSPPPSSDERRAPAPCSAS